MKTLTDDLAVRQLGALAQGSRLAIFRALVMAGADGLTAGEIAATCGMAPNALSFHAKELLGAGLATARNEGRFVRYVAAFDAMNDLLGYLSENCCGGDDCGVGVQACRPKKSAKAATTT